MIKDHSSTISKEWTLEGTETKKLISDRKSKNKPEVNNSLLSDLGKSIVKM